MRIIPPINPKMLPWIIEAGKKVWQHIQNWMNIKVKTASEKQPLTKNSSATDFQEMQQLFSDLQQEIGKAVEGIEKEVLVEINEYLSQFQFLLSSNLELKNKYQISTMKYKREVTRIQKQCSGFLENDVASSVNLLNPQIREILMMLPGSKKEQALKNFITTAIDTALDNFSRFFEEEISYLSTLIEDDIHQQLKQLELVNSEKLRQLSTLINTFDEGTEKNENLQVDAYLNFKTLKELESIMNK